MAYNEAQTLHRTCEEILAVCALLDVPSELVIIDDGSTDGTEQQADTLARIDPRVRVVHHAPNRGLGGVYRTGFREVRGHYVTFFPADGQFPADIIADFLPRMQDCDMVLGYLPRGTRTVVAEALSSGERLLYRMLLGRFPRFQGILMFRRALLDLYPLKSEGRGWAVLMELVIRSARAGHRLVSVPTKVRARTHGESKVNNVRTIWSNARQVLALRALLDDSPTAR